MFTGAISSAWPPAVYFGLAGRKFSKGQMQLTLELRLLVLLAALEACLPTSRLQMSLIPPFNVSHSNDFRSVAR